jgi:hypothetical protein
MEILVFVHRQASVIESLLESLRGEENIRNIRKKANGEQENIEHWTVTCSFS